MTANIENSMTHENPLAVSASPASIGSRLVVYNLLMVLMALPGLALAAFYLAFSPRRRQTFLYRLWLRDAATGRNDLPKRGQRPIWVHALSVGEVLSAVDLVHALKKVFPKRPVVFSVSTQTGFQTACRQIADRVDTITYFPYDLAFSVRKAARTLDPALVVLVETDLWPNFIGEMTRRRVPMLLVNARLSDRSFAGYRRLRGIMAPMLSSFSRICAQTPADACRFARLGVDPRRVHVTGNLKFDHMPGPAENIEFDWLPKPLQGQTGGQLLVAGSTHEGEEALVMEAFEGIRQAVSNAFLVIAPRDVGRAASVCRLAASRGFSMGVPAEAGRAPARLDGVVVDRLGLLAPLYGRADVAFIGGSLVAQGGHNPLEPAVVSTPMLFGPYMTDFREIAQQLLTSGAAVEVDDARALCREVVLLMNHPDLAKDRGKKARQVVSANRGAVERSIDVIRACLEPDDRIGT
jgi:3-deoxy-D-manno-octulosonic-acid transferase